LNKCITLNFEPGTLNRLMLERLDDGNGWNGWNGSSFCRLPPHASCA
jgi:hypothetical protein